MTKICTKIAVTQGCGEFRWVWALFQFNHREMEFW